MHHCGPDTTLAFSAPIQKQSGLSKKKPPTGRFSKNSAASPLRFNLKRVLHANRENIVVIRIGVLGGTGVKTTI